jgi:hypothetical protein
MNEQFTTNTSGQGKNSTVPPAIQWFNWGSFVFSSLWFLRMGLANEQKWHDIKDFLREKNQPELGRAVLLTYGWGTLGNEIAWRFKHWDTLELFLRTQKRWSIIGKTILWAVLSAMSILMLWFVILVLQML